MGILLIPSDLNQFWIRHSIKALELYQLSDSSWENAQTMAGFDIEITIQNAWILYIITEHKPFTIEHDMNFWFVQTKKYMIFGVNVVALLTSVLTLYVHSINYDIFFLYFFWGKIVIAVGIECDSVWLLWIPMKKHDWKHFLNSSDKEIWNSLNKTIQFHFNG